MLTRERLKELLDYDSASGVFTWKDVRNGRVEVGGIAGYIQHGYVNIQIDNKTYKAHRLAWLYVYGEFPQNDIDHINHARSDNRIVNLRDVTSQENARNKSIPRHNTSGIMGVQWSESRQRWIGQLEINIDGKRKAYFRRFKTLEEAVAYRQGLEKLYGFNENHGKD